MGRSARHQPHNPRARTSLKIENDKGEEIYSYRGPGAKHKPAVLRWHGQHYTMAATNRKGNALGFKKKLEAIDRSLRQARLREKPEGGREDDFIHVHANGLFTFFSGRKQTKA